MAFLYHIKPDGQPECWEVGERPLLLGRGDFADAYVDDDALSRSHFLIVREHDDYFVVDLHSSNGTWIDGAAVTARRIGAGQFILAGDSFFYFSEIPVAADAIPRAVPLPQMPQIPIAEASAA
jgi:pSer/pThr/pTyr-binding forkhead associated (FHA) protein